MIEAREFRQPRDLAVHLSKYVTCPSTIVAGTANHFGKARAISLEQATRLVMAERKKRERAVEVAKHKAKESEKFDGETFAVLPNGGADVLASVTVPTIGAAKALWPAWYQPRPRQFPADLVKLIGEAVGASYAEMLGSARTGVVIAARAVVYKILRERGLSLPQIGRHMANRDHTTVMNALEKFPYYCKRYPEARAAYELHRERSVPAACSGDAR